MKTTVLTSVFNPSEENLLLLKYIDNYLKSAENLQNIEDIVFNIRISSLNKRVQSLIFNELKFFDNILKLSPHSSLSITGEKENYATTINQCIRNAKTDYVVIWNIDDVMTPDSIMSLTKTLEENPEVSMTYGDFNVCNDLELKHVIQKITTPEFTKSEDFVLKYPFGPSITWRRKINNEIGYYDEQLQSSVDIDFTTRLALNSHKFKKTKKHVCNFLNIGKGLSTKLNTRMFQENDILKHRYVNNKGESEIDGIRLNYLKNFNTFRALI